MSKAFDLSLALDGIGGSSKGSSRIDCLEYLSGLGLFLGTGDGLLCKYGIIEGVDGRICFVYEAGVDLKEGSKATEGGSTINFLRGASALNRLILCMDSNLLVLSLEDLSLIPLPGASKLKGISKCSVNENPTQDNPFSLQVINLPLISIC